MRRVGLALALAIGVICFWWWEIHEATQSSAHEVPATPSMASPVSEKAEASRRLEVDSPSSGVENAALPENWAALLDLFSPEQRERLETLRARYPVAFEFSNANQFRWMLEHGFPHPADWLRTEKLSEAELIRRAELGDLTAAAVGYDTATNATESLFNATGELNRGASSLTGRAAMFEQTLGQACTPFLGYLRARNAAVNYPNTPESVLPGYLYAASLGDQRAAAFARQRALALGISKEALALANMSALQFQMALPSRCLSSPMPAGDP